jgi:hypothetical protein
MEMWLAPSTCVPRVISSQQCQWHQNSKPQGEEEKRDKPGASTVTPTEDEIQHCDF